MEKCTSTTLMENGRRLLLGSLWPLLTLPPGRLSTGFKVNALFFCFFFLEFDCLVMCFSWFFEKSVMLCLVAEIVYERVKLKF